jgi:seryl-tRNA synthetase
MAAALQFLQENGLTDYDALAERTAAAVDRAHVLAGELREVEERLASTTKLMGAVVDYAKTRPVFDGYKAARYSKKYLAEHEEALASYRAAKAAINDILDGAKLPRMDALKKQRRELADKKKALYAEYRQAQRDMRQAVAVKANIDHLLGLTDGRTDKEQTR